MTEQFTKLQIGTPFEIFKGRNIQGQCGTIFEQLVNGSMCLVVYLDKMSISEYLALREQKIMLELLKKMISY
jgi:hypothetical protein